MGFGTKHRLPDAATFRRIRCYPLLMPRVLIATLAALALLAPAADAQTSLQKSLSHSMASAGRFSGAFVIDADSGSTLYSSRANAPRVLASNTKLFTSAAVLGRLGA